MKVVAGREALYRGFQRAGSVISSGIQQTIYRNVMLRAAEGDVFLTATDLEIGMTLCIKEVTVEQEGVVVLPADRISRILAATPDEYVTIIESDGSVALQSGDSEIVILGEDPTDFASLPELPPEGVVEIDPEVLRYMVRCTLFAAAPDKGRYALNGVLFALGEEDGIEMAAADGSRLAVVSKKVSNPSAVQGSFIVPTRAVDQVARLAGYGEEPLRFASTDKQFIAQNEVGRIVCQLVEGQFPNYREVIPADSKVKVQLPVTELLSAVRRAGYLTTEESRVVDFCFAPGKLTLRSESAGVGHGELNVPVEYEGEEIKISFNPDYIESLLAIVERETIKMRFSDRRSPCVIKSGVDFTYVVSPVIREEGMA